MPLDRRSLFRIAGASLGVGALYRALPVAAAGEGLDALRLLGARNGEAPEPFTFVQISDTHVGFAGPPNPTGTAAFERAVEVVNALPERPDLVLFTGDLTHGSEKPGEPEARMKRFREIAGKLNVKTVKHVPGEHDAGLDGGVRYRGAFGEPHYAFDHKGVHFVALDNVSQGKPVVGAEQLAWMKRDLARFAPSTPIVVFTHRPLFDLAPEWEWFTGDGDEVMNALAPFENVTVLYGHIHRRDVRTLGRARHLASRSLVFAFPDPASGAEKKPLPFAKETPFANLGVRELARGAAGIEATEVELTVKEYAGANGADTIRKGGTL